MTVTHDRLYQLLPTVYRMRDAEVGEPLRALLSVVSEQLDLLEDDIAGLYDNWFVETCEEWVLPYLASLVGLPPASPQIPMRRADVANAVASARRKGTLPVLEDLARDVAGWPARAVEFYRLLSVFQALDHLRLDRGAVLSARDPGPLERLGGPFDEVARMVDVRRISSGRSRRRHNVPSVGVFVWRLGAYSLTEAPAYCDDRVRSHYHFSILGNDTPLVVQPLPEPGPFHVADERNVPAFISRRAFFERTVDFYGPGRSLLIWRDGLDEPVPLDDVVAADLSGWAYKPKGRQVAVDPELGRIAFNSRHAPESGVWVTYHTAFSADIGGGEYARAVDPVGPRRHYTVGRGGGFDRIMSAVEQWRADIAADPRATDAVIELVDSGAYQESIDIVLDVEDRLELRAAPRTRPVVRLLDWYSNRPDSMRIRVREAVEGGGPVDEDRVGSGEIGDAHDARRAVPVDPCHDESQRRPSVVLDGLLVTGRSVQLQGPLGDVVIRHCTLVPGWSLDDHCAPRHQGEPSLTLDDTTAEVVIDRSIVGGIVVNGDEVDTDPVVMKVVDSIVDATDRDLDALGAPDGRYAHVRLRIERTTVLGGVRAHVVSLGQDTIFDGELRTARRQEGCLRFCWVPSGSRTPARYRCQPDAAITAGGDELLVRPRFTSRRYGTPEYAQLADDCPTEIAEGAEDESEIGAFHHLYQPQREAALRARLDQFTPADFDIAVVHAT